MTPPDRPGWRIVIVGTGGQGVLTAAHLLASFHVARGSRVVSGQAHGMARRGGAVQSTVKIDCGNSPVIRRGAADVVLGLEPIETARALPTMSDRTIVFMNTCRVAPYVLSQRAVRGAEGADYPAIDELEGAIRAVAPTLLTLDATRTAEEAGSVKTLNVVLLGCLFGTGLLPGSAEEFGRSIVEGAPKALVDTNLRAFEAGVEFGRRVEPIEGDLRA